MMQIDHLTIHRGQLCVADNISLERYHAFTEATRYSLNSADKKTLTDVVRLFSEI